MSAIEKGNAIHEAIANADAHLNNVGMPTYSELLAVLDWIAAGRVVVDGTQVSLSRHGMKELAKQSVKAKV